MLLLCAICAEPLTEQARQGGEVCLLCAHRTTAPERMQRRALAGVIDTA